MWQHQALVSNAQLAAQSLATLCHMLGAVATERVYVKRVVVVGSRIAPVARGAKRHYTITEAVAVQRQTVTFHRRPPHIQSRQVRRCLQCRRHR